MDIHASIRQLKKRLHRIDTSTKRIDVVVNYAKEHTQAQRCSIFVYQEQTDQLKTIYADGIKGLSLQSNAGLVGYAFHKRQSLLENDTSHSKLFLKAVDKKSGYNTTSVLVVPLISKDNSRLGVIQLLNKPSGFIKDDTLLIEHITPLLIDTILINTIAPTPTTLPQSEDTTQVNFDSYLADKKLYLMEDYNAYYKIVGMKRDYFIGADKCYMLTPEAKEIEISYFSTHGDFLFVKMRLYIDETKEGLFINEFHFKRDFQRYALEKDA